MEWTTVVHHIEFCQNKMNTEKTSDSEKISKAKCIVCSKTITLLTGNKVRLYFTEMNS